MQYIRYEDLGLTRADNPNVNQFDDGGFTPLYRAIEREDIIELKRLLSNDAYVNIVGKDGETPFHLAAVNDDIEALELLLPHCDDVDHLYISRFHQFKRTALYYARNPKAIEILIKNGADVKKAPEGNYYFFYHAILDKNLSLIKMLSDKGADASGLNIYGRMPLVLQKFYNEVQHREI